MTHFQKLSSFVLVAAIVLSGCAVQEPERKIVSTTAAISRKAIFDFDIAYETPVSQEKEQFRAASVGGIAPNAQSKTVGITRRGVTLVGVYDTAHDSVLYMGNKSEKSAKEVNSMTTATALITPFFSIASRNPDIQERMHSLAEKNTAIQGLAAAIDAKIAERGYWDIEDVQTEFLAAYHSFALALEQDANKRLSSKRRWLASLSPVSFGVSPIEGSSGKVTMSNYDMREGIFTARATNSSFVYQEMQNPDGTSNLLYSAEIGVLGDSISETIKNATWNLVFDWDKLAVPQSTNISYAVPAGTPSVQFSASPFTVMGGTFTLIDTASQFISAHDEVRSCFDVLNANKMGWWKNYSKKLGFIEGISGASADAASQEHMEGMVDTMTQYLGDIATLLAECGAKSAEQYVENGFVKSSAKLFGKALKILGGEAKNMKLLQVLIAEYATLKPSAFQLDVEWRDAAAEAAQQEEQQREKEQSAALSPEAKQEQATQKYAGYKVMPPHAEVRDGKVLVENIYAPGKIEKPDFSSVSCTMNMDEDFPCENGLPTSCVSAVSGFSVNPTALYVEKSCGNDSQIWYYHNESHTEGASFVGFGSHPRLLEGGSLIYLDTEGKVRIEGRDFSRDDFIPWYSVYLYPRPYKFSLQGVMMTERKPTPKELAEDDAWAEAETQRQIDEYGDSGPVGTLHRYAAPSSFLQVVLLDASGKKLTETMTDKEGNFTLAYETKSLHKPDFSMCVYPQQYGDVKEPMTIEFSRCLSGKELIGFSDNARYFPENTPLNEVVEPDGQYYMEYPQEKGFEFERNKKSGVYEMNLGFKWRGFTISAEEKALIPREYSFDI